MKSSRKSELKEETGSQNRAISIDSWVVSNFLGGAEVWVTRRTIQVSDYYLGATEKHRITISHASSAKSEQEVNLLKSASPQMELD